MFDDSLMENMISVAFRVILYLLQAGPASVRGSCLTGGFFFARGRNMVDNHALRGHVIANVTVTEPIHCFRACRLDCRCISFNYQPGMSQDNCQLNEESKYMNSSALEFLEGWQYYDLIVDYDIKANGPIVECQNGCCGSNPCLDGGTCHETCHVNGKRFRCECGPANTGRYCESHAICSTPDWLPYGNACFKLVNMTGSWIEAQDACRSRYNSNLTSIHSAEENDFVRQIANIFRLDSVWIGLNKLDSADGNYEWVDGSDLTYTNWVIGEPAGGTENCAAQWNSGLNWNDLPCASDYFLPYVCGRRLSLELSSEYCTNTE